MPPPEAREGGPGKTAPSSTHPEAGNSTAEAPAQGLEPDVLRFLDQRLEGDGAETIRCHVDGHAGLCTGRIPLVDVGEFRRAPVPPCSRGHGFDEAWDWLERRIQMLVGPWVTSSIDDFVEQLARRAREAGLDLAALRPVVRQALRDAT